MMISFSDSGEVSLPKAWREERIGDAYRFTRKPKEIRYSDFAAIPFVPMNLIPEGGALAPSFKEKRPNEISSGTYFERGDLLLSKITPSFENGKQAIALDLPTPFGMATTEVIPIQAIKGTSDIHFLFYYLLKDDVRKAIAAKMEGSTGRQRVPEHVVREWLIPLPPLSEQEKIATVLWKIQKAVEIEAAILRNARDLKKSLLRRLFTHGLRGEPLKETEIGPLPQSWTETTLGDVCSENGGRIQTGPFGSQLHASDYQTDGIPVVNPTHLADNKINHAGIPQISRETAKQLNRHELEEGDILFARRGEIGRHGLVGADESGWLCGTGCFLVRVKSGSVCNEFLSFWFSTEPIVQWLNAHAAGAIMPNLNNIVLGRIPLALPDIEEQREIAKTLQAVNRKIDIHESKKRSLQDLFKTTLHKLMTAQIRVNNLEIDTRELD